MRSPSSLVTEERRDFRLRCGIGRDAPKEFRDARGTFDDGMRESECMYSNASPYGEREAGTSKAPSSLPVSEDRTDEMLLLLSPISRLLCDTTMSRGLLLAFDAVEEIGRRSVPSKAGMLSCLTPEAPNGRKSWTEARQGEMLEVLYMSPERKQARGGQEKLNTRTIRCRGALPLSLYMTFSFAIRGNFHFGTEQQKYRHI
jgi:hypothetical protein